MDTFKMPLRFVWGILPVDRGNYFDPFSRGKLYLDETFSMSSIESQIWLLGFCKSLKNQTFYSTTMSPWLPNCFIEKFITWMSRRCMDKMADIDRSPCCENSTFPYDPPIFEQVMNFNIFCVTNVIDVFLKQCILESISSLYQTPREFFIPGVAGPKFGRKPDTENVDGISNDSRLLIATIKAVVIEYDSNQVYTMSYTKMSEFFNNVEYWFRKQLETAPETMRNGWFVSDLDFFDLQQTLSMGTLLAIILAMSVALLVLLLVTLNILISIYAILAVTFTITTTIAILILLGWKLNILESVAVSSAIGLAVDFSLHYGVHYRFSPDTDRETATKFSLKRMIGPTIMAATTTGLCPYDSKRYFFTYLPSF
jgi:protein dispatched 1